MELTSDENLYKKVGEPVSFRKRVMKAVNFNLENELSERWEHENPHACVESLGLCMQCVKRNVTSFASLIRIHASMFWSRHIAFLVSPLFFFLLFFARDPSVVSLVRMCVHFLRECMMCH